VFALQDKVIEHILAAEREAEARAAAPTTVDPIQQTVTETVKDCIRRRTVDRDEAKVRADSSSWRLEGHLSATSSPP
jgi:hypothetical protein